MDNFVQTLKTGTMAEKKKAIIERIELEQNIQNARQLVNKINEKCFQACVPKPNSYLNPAEEGCVSKCMEKYMGAWNIVSKEYVDRASKERLI